jgi:hypothetical protein
MTMRIARSPNSRALGGFWASVATALLAALTPEVPGATCCPPVTVAETLWPAPLIQEGYGAIPATLHADARGGVYATWQEIADVAPGTFAGRPGLRVSRDDGDTWQPPIEAFAPETGWMFDVAVDGSGTLLLAYRGADGVYASVSHDQARTFQTSVRLGDVGGDAPNIKAVLGPNGVALVAWSGMVATSLDHGDTWGSAVSAGGAPADAVITEDAEVVAWVADRDALVSRSVDGGMTWSPPVVVFDGMPLAPGARTVTLTRTSGGHVVAAVHTPVPLSLSNNRLYIYTSSDSGTSWQDAMTLSVAVSAGLDYSIAGYPNGHVVLAFHEAPSAYRSITVSQQHGLPGTWRRGAAQFGESRVDGLGLSAHEWLDGSLVVTHRSEQTLETGCDSGIAECESAWLDRSCNGGDSWLVPELRLDSDAPPRLPLSSAPRSAISASGRLHVLWVDSDAFADTDDELHHVALERAVNAELDLVVRDLATTPCDPPLYRLEADVGPGTGCASPTVQWYQDGAPIAGATGAIHDIPADTPRGRHAYTYRVTCDPALDCAGGGDEAPVVSLDFDANARRPVLRMVEEPSTGCLWPRYHLSVDPRSIATCPGPAFQWHQDGSPIPGATGLTHDVPADEQPGVHWYEVVITCDVTPPCAMTSLPIDVDVAQPTSAVVGLELAGRLRVTREPAAVALSWTDASFTAEGYNVYAGGIGSWYDHAGLACSVTRMPVDARDTRLLVSLPADDTYYLVAPADCAGEGSVGADSLLRWRPLAGSGAACGPIR